MKINTVIVYSFLLVVVLFYSCKNEEKDTSNAEIVSEMSDAAIIDEGEYQIFEGQIDGQYDIIMKIDLTKNTVKGELIYKSVGVPIRLEGGLNDNFLEMKEIIDGSSHAKFAGELENDVFNGVWVKSGSSQKLPLSMKVSNSDFNSFIDEEKVNEVNLER